MRALFILLFTAGCSLPYPEVSPPANLEAESYAVNTITFTQAKKLGHTLHTLHPRSFYCDCLFVGNKLIPGTCGYIPKNKSNWRSEKIEWEHVVPASTLGKHLSEWRDGHANCVTRAGKRYKGRACAQKESEVFREMEGNLHNLVPAIGEINLHRSNYILAEITDSNDWLFGDCDFEIDYKKRVVEPREQVKGDVARIYAYMDKEYPGLGIVNDYNRDILARWAAFDPVDTWECLRAQLIKELTGKNNPVVDGFCTTAFKSFAQIIQGMEGKNDEK